MLPSTTTKVFGAAVICRMASATCAAGSMSGANCGGACSGARTSEPMRRGRDSAMSDVARARVRALLVKFYIANCSFSAHRREHM